MSAESKLLAARIGLLRTHPFWGSLALGLKLKADPGCGTAWVDGRNFGYDPAFIEKLNHDQLMALCAHEVEHVALGHPWRRDGRDMKQWNIACDKTINNDLKQAGFQLPPNGVYATGDEIGKSAEWIFTRTKEAQAPPQTPPQKKQQGGTGGAGKGQQQQDDQQQGGQPGQQQPQPEPDPLGEVRDAPTEPDADGTPAPDEGQWKQRVASAMQQAKMQGKMSAGMARKVELALRPKIDIKSLLLRFFNERTASDYTWARPNVRYIPGGLYMPSLDSKKMGAVAVYIDTSGSMDQVALNHAKGIVEQVIDECDPESVFLVFGDSKVCNTTRMEKGEPLTWEPKGGGGTDFRPVVKAIEDEPAQVVCAVAITDLDGTFPDYVPEIPFIFLSTNKRNPDKVAPFGETAHVDY